MQVIRRRLPRDNRFRSLSHRIFDADCPAIRKHLRDELQSFIRRVGLHFISESNLDQVWFHHGGSHIGVCSTSKQTRFMNLDKPNGALTIKYHSGPEKVRSEGLNAKGQTKAPGS